MIQKFLQESGFLPDADVRAKVSAAFASEIEAAMRGGPSSLRMLQSYIPGEVDLPVDAAKPVIVVDAGGTNLRVASIRLTQDGPVISHLRKSPMPGTQGALSADAFHAAIASEVDAVRALEPFAARIGYCFSYECRSLPDRDAELLAWSKQIEAPEVVGQRVGHELARRLAGGPLPVVVLNDTVATLLAGRSRPDGARMGQLGFILGTGTNIACVEDGMIRNAESGNCDKMPRTPVDIAYGDTLPDGGAAPFEQMVSGGYLGGVGLFLLRAAARAGVLDGEGLSTIPALSTLELESFSTGVCTADNPLMRAIAVSDIPAAREIARAVFQRAAVFTAAHLATFVRRSVDAGHTAVRITVDGSTYWKTRAVDFDGLVRVELAATLPGVPIEIVRIDEAPMIGAAVAALM